MTTSPAASGNAVTAPLGPETATMGPDLLLRARTHLRIVHHIPGRIRLRFGPGILHAVPEIASADVTALMAGIGGIKDVRVNAAAFTLVVRYEPSRLQPALWERLINGDDAAAREIIDQLQRRGNGQ